MSDEAPSSPGAPRSTEPAPSAAPRSGRSGRSIALLPWLIALVAVVAAATFGFALSRQGAAGGAVEDAARRFTAALLTYDSDELAEARSRMRPLATDRFFANYEKTLTALAKVTGAAEGAATEVLVALSGPDKASAVVVTDSVADTVDGTARTTGSYLRLDLVRDEGRWKVDAVVELFAGARKETAAG